MKRWFKKALCAAVAAASLVTLAAPAMAESDREKVTLIVQMESGSSVSQLQSVSDTGRNEAESEANITNRILREQRNVQRRIFLSVDSDIEFGYSYTAAMNGFSLEADPADIESIKALDGVKNVYISRSHKVNAPDEERLEDTIHTDYSCVITHIDKLHEQGYRGEGMVIAVVDTEFDTNHEFLSGDVENPKYTKAKMSDAIQSLELNTDSVNRVWKSEKVPFA